MWKTRVDKILKHKFRYLYAVILSMGLSFLSFCIFYDNETSMFLINYKDTHDTHIYITAQEGQTYSMKDIDQRDILSNHSLFQSHDLAPLYISHDSSYDMTTGELIKASFQIDDSIKNDTMPLISYYQLSQFHITQSFSQGKGIYVTTDFIKEMGLQDDAINSDTSIELTIPIPIYHKYAQSHSDNQLMTLSVPFTVQTQISGIVEPDYDLEKLFQTSSYVLFPYELIENVKSDSDNINEWQDDDLSPIYASAYQIKCSEDQLQETYHHINQTFQEEDIHLNVSSPYLDVLHQEAQQDKLSNSLFLGSSLCCLILIGMLIYRKITKRFLKRPIFHEKEYIQTLDKHQCKQYFKQQNKMRWRMLWCILTMTFISLWIILDLIYPQGNTNTLVMIFVYIILILILRCLFFLKMIFQYFRYGLKKDI